MQTPILFDGAFGTYYYALTAENSLCERANLSRSDVVRRIHREYLLAGCRAIRTNTFAANPVQFPHREELRSVLREGFRLATQEAEPYGAQVFCSIGCVADKQLAPEAYRTVAEEFAALGAECVIFETLDSLEGVEEACAYLRRVLPGITLAVSIAANQDATTARGLSAGSLIRKARTFADIVGFNCRMGPAHLAALLRTLPASDVPLLALPNAGYPASVGGRIVFENDPEYFAHKAGELPRLGAVYVGGCCGTTPRHMECLREQLSVSLPFPADSRTEKEPEIRAPLPTLQGRGKKYVAVELDPPVDADLSFFLSCARTFTRAGVDAVTVSDSPFSKTRADALMCALRLVQEGVPAVIPHITCRDKNHVALKGGLLAANASGIDRVFLVTGDPPLKGENVRTSGVFSFNSFELISYVNTLNEEVFRSRPFLVGAALNVNARNFSSELSRAAEKEAAGASYFLTQPVFSDAALENLALSRRRLKGKLLCGVMPVAGYKNARFLQSEVPGTGVPQSLVDALRDKEPGEAKEIALSAAKTVIDRAYEICDGFFLMLPLKKVDYITELIEYIQSKEVSLC